jgi:hypothetical protein
MPVLRTVLGLGPRRWTGAIKLASLALLVEAGLKTVSLLRLARWLHVPLTLDRSSAPIGRLDQLSLTEAEGDLLDTARRVLRHRPFNGTCLRRALIAGYVLRHHDPTLRIGVAKYSRQVEAHAWLEIGGISLDPDASKVYQAFQSPSGVGRADRRVA